MVKSVVSFLESSFCERFLLFGREIKNFKRIFMFYVFLYLGKGGFFLRIFFISILIKWC